MIKELTLLDGECELKQPMLVQTGDRYREPIVRAFKKEQGWHEVELNQL